VGEVDDGGRVGDGVGSEDRLGVGAAVGEAAVEGLAVAPPADGLGAAGPAGRVAGCRLVDGAAAGADGSSGPGAGASDGAAAGVAVLVGGTCSGAARPGTSTAGW
jgi:hypothetical protein